MNITLTHDDLFLYAKDLVEKGLVDLPGDIKLLLTIEDDDWTALKDFKDFYGDVVSVRDCEPDDISGYYKRPKMFDGSARKIYTRYDIYWWQPPKDIVSDKQELAKSYESMKETLLYGFQLIRVEKCQGCDAYGKPYVVEFQTIGGLEWHRASDKEKEGVVLDALYMMSDKGEIS